MAPDDVIEVVAPVTAESAIVDVPAPDAVAVPPDATPAEAKPAEAKPVVTPPEPKNPDLELLEALRKERDREREERQIERRKLTEEATRQIQAERRRAAEAERELQTRTNQAVKAHWQAVNSDLQQITSAIGSTKGEIENAKRDLALASEAGDHAKAADAQERIALAAADLRALEYGQTGANQRVEEARRAIEAMAERENQPASRQPAPQQRQQQRPQPDQRQPAPQTPDQWIAQCPAATQDWLKTNKDYVTDPKLNRKLLRFADEWVDDNGMESLNTAAFVKALNGRFGRQEAAEVAKTQESNGQIPEDGIIEIDPNSGMRTSIARRAVAQAAAPVSRPVAPTSASRSPTRIRLSPEQMAIAPRIYPEAKSEQEARALYAADLIKAQAEGKFASRE